MLKIQDKLLEKKTEEAKWRCFYVTPEMQAHFQTYFPILANSGID